MKGLLLVLACMLLVGAAFPGAAAQAEPTGLALPPGDLSRMGEVNSAAPWQQGSLLGTSTGVYFYPGQAEDPSVLQLPQAEGSSQPAALTAILTQEDRAYALSLPAGCIWEILWDGQVLRLSAPRSFDTEAFLLDSQQGPARTWVPQQVLLTGDTLCVLSRRMQELGGSVMMLTDLQTGQTRAFPQVAGQMILHVSLYHDGRLLALAHGGEAARVVELDLEAGSQTPYAQLAADIRPGEAAILYHPGEDALYIKSGNRLLRRSPEGQVKEAAFLNVEAGHFIRFGRLSLMGPGLFAAAHPAGLAVASLADNDTKPLVLWNVDARDPAHVSAMGRMGNTPVRLVQLNIGEISQRLAEVLVGRLAEPDIFLVYADEVDLKRLMAKGYALSLGTGHALTAFAKATYPAMQELCFAENQLFFLPVGLAPDGLQVNPAAFVELDVPVPGDIRALIRLVESWPELSEDRDEYALFSFGTPRGRLTDALWSTWLAESTLQGTPLTLQDPAFSSLLTAIDQAALTGWPRRQPSPEARALFPHDLGETLDLVRWTSYFNWERQAHGAAVFPSFPLPLAMEEGSQPVFPVRLMLLGINPHSSQPEAALSYLQHFLAAMPVARRMLLCPDLNQPVPHPQLPRLVEEAEQALQMAQEGLANAAPDADRHALDAAVSQAHERLDHWRSNPPIISAEAIHMYRDLMAQAVVMTYPGTGGSAKDSLEPLLARFRMGTIGSDELIREAEGVLRLSGLEDQ